MWFSGFCTHVYNGMRHHSSQNFDYILTTISMKIFLRVEMGMRDPLTRAALSGLFNGKSANQIARLVAIVIKIPLTEEAQSAAAKQGRSSRA